MATISTNTGKAAIAEKIGGLGSSGDFTYLHLGSDGTAASTADTQLGSEFTDSGLQPAAATVSTDAANILQLVHKFTATAQKTIRESGAFAAPPQDIGTSLVSHFKMNDDDANTNVYDNIGDVNAVASSNTSVLSETGRINKALGVYNDGDKITLSNANASAIIGMSYPFTVSWWFKLKSGGTWNPGEAVFWSFDYNYATNYQFMCYFENWTSTGVKCEFYVRNADSPGEMVFGVDQSNIIPYISDTDWHNFVFVIDSNPANGKIYFDGVQITANSQSGSGQDFSSISEPLVIGSQYGGNAGQFAIDDLRFYDRGLTGDQAAALYAAGSGTEAETVVSVCGPADSLDEQMLTSGDDDGWWNNDPNARRIARDSNGGIWTVQKEDTNDGYLFTSYSSDGGTTWSAGVAVENDNNTDYTNIFVDQNDYVHVLYRLGTVLKHKLYNGSWQTPVVIATATPSMFATMDTSGNIYVFGADNTTSIQYYKYTNSTNTWSTQSSVTAPAVVIRGNIGADVDSNGYPHIAYRADSSLYHDKWTGSAWAGPTLISTVDTVNSFPTIVVTSDDNVMVVWRRVSGYFWYAYYTTSWSTEAQLNTGTIYSSHTMSRDRDNNIYLCGEDNPNLNMVVFKWTGSSWDSGTLWKTVTGSDYMYDGSTLYGSLEYQIPCSGFANAYTNGIDSPYSERPYYFSNASWYSGGTPVLILSRSSFDPINVDTGDSVTITTKVTID